jgi:hypothetical protein
MTLDLTCRYYEQALLPVSAGFDAADVTRDGRVFGAGRNVLPPKAASLPEVCS